MRTSRINTNDVGLAIGMLLMIFLIVTYQKRTEYQIPAKQMENLNYLPSGSFLKGMALGYDEAFADFLWVKTVGYFGTHAKTDQDYTWLIHMLKLTIELDPRYDSPYEFAGVILPAKLGNVDEGIAFLKKGLNNVPKTNKRYWLQPFYLGFLQMIYKDDPLKAAHYFEIAARYPQSPPYLPLLATRLYGRAGKPGVGIDIIQSVLDEKSTIRKQRDYVQEGLKKRIKQLIAAQEIQMLENACALYISTFGHKPERLKDLVDGMLLPFIPEDPFGGIYFLSFNGDAVLSTRYEGDF